VITGLSEHQWVALSDSSYGIAVRAKLLTGMSRSLRLKIVKDKIHQFFLCQVLGNVTKPLRELQMSRLLASPSSERTRRGPQQIILHYLRCMPLLSSCPGSQRDPRGDTSLFWSCAEGGCAGPLGEAAVGRGCQRAPWSGASSLGHT